MTKNPSAHKDEELLEADRLKYEVMAIIDPDVGSVDYKKDFDALKSLIENHGGSIWNEEEWGKRELAYLIKKKTHGFYVVVDFDAAPSQVPEMIRQLKITPFIVRSLLVKLPDEYVPQHYDLDEALQEKKPVEKGEKKEEPKAKPKPVKKVEPKV
ncbi:MAG: 30S ribosomal protein S6, partial [Candidatus Gracilibacteria bacterium]